MFLYTCSFLHCTGAVPRPSKHSQFRWLKKDRRHKTGVPKAKAEETVKNANLGLKCRENIRKLAHAPSFYHVSQALMHYAGSVWV